jgi:hypothetical protein
MYSKFTFSYCEYCVYTIYIVYRADETTGYSIEFWGDDAWGGDGGGGVCQSVYGAGKEMRETSGNRCECILSPPPFNESVGYGVLYIYKNCIYKYICSRTGYVSN